jgi:hypothetical protein
VSEPARAPAAVEGPAFPWPLKALASACVLALLVFGLLAAGRQGWHEVNTQGWLLLAGALAVVGTGWWTLVTSRTRIDGRSIRQTGLWLREVELADISQLKLIRLRGFEWVFVPRLVVRARGHALPVTFQLGTAGLVEACSKLAYGE